MITGIAYQSVPIENPSMGGTFPGNDFRNGAKFDGSALVKR